MKRPTSLAPTMAARLGLALIALGTAIQSHAGLVTTEADDGSPGTLRSQIAAASPGDSITFGPALAGKTITLTAGELVVERDLAIHGPGASGLAISGNGQRVFAIRPGVIASLGGLTIRDGKSTGDGGGIFNEGNLTVRACTLSGNTARDRGGAISSTGTLTLETCTIRGNGGDPANYFFIYGGGLHSSGTLVIRGSVFTGNSGRFGSAIASSGSALLVNTTLTANQSTRGPYSNCGALFNFGPVTLEHCTITDNQVNGIENGSRILARNCILARNPWGNLARLSGNSEFITEGVNLSDDETCPGATLVAAPQLALAPLGDHGGPVMTLALLPGSAAIDAAPDCLDGSGIPLTEDQRGYPRPFGPGCDVGAYEAQDPADLPVARPESYSLDEDGLLQVTAPGVLGNDQDPHNLGLTVTGTTAPAHGTLEMRTDGSFRYQPLPNYNGPDSFTYYVTDGLYGPGAATVSILVRSVNDAPIAEARSLRSLRDVPVGVVLAASDIEGDSFTLELVDSPSHGVLSGTIPYLTYTPAPGYVGTDRFTYRATDVLGSSGMADVSIDVRPYTIWTGPRTTVRVSNACAGYVPCPDPRVSDPLTAGVVMAASLDSALPYNSAIEATSDLWTAMSPLSPADTEWARGTTADLASLRFLPFPELAQAFYEPTGENLVLHLISEGVLIDIRFIEADLYSFFTYERSTPGVPLTLNGPSRISLLCGQPFVDPGATAMDLDGTPLAVSVTGQVDTSAAGTYVVTYTATDSTGRVGTLRRTVEVGSIQVTVYSGYTRAGGGAPFSNPVGSFLTGSVQFAPFGNFSWHPLGLDTFGAEIRGALSVEDDGPHTFSLESDDGSVLFIDGQPVVDNGGDHGPQLRTGTVQLARGRHCFAIQFYNSGGLSGLNLGLPSGVSYACPTLDCPTEVRRFSEAGSCGAVVDFDLPGLADPCLDLTVTCNPPPGSFFPVGSTPVTCQAALADGSVLSQCTFNVTVVDAIQPTVTCPGDRTVITTSSQGMAVAYPAATATDNCAPPAISYSQASGTRFPLGTTSVTARAADQAGNTASCWFAIRVVYAWSGFQSPIAPDGSTVLKTGTSVNVRFQLTGASAGIQDAVAWFRCVRRTSSSGGGQAMPGGLFRYDPKKGQYAYNWNTKGLPAGFYELEADLGDGVPRKAVVELRSGK